MNIKVLLAIAGVGLVILLGVVFWPSGGKRDRDLPARIPIRGTVSYNGKAPVGAYVILTRIPLDQNAWDTVVPKGRVEEDGSFQVQCFEENDGAPAGEYAVTVAWTGFKDPFIKPGVDKFRGRFSNPTKPLQTVTVPESADEEGLVLPSIELTGPAIEQQSDDEFDRGR